ncbi:hypothetical protein HYFRA_00011657 [Hymenoscyphus fraxineus]|uniref:Uncharacterized protein n=1 Tax=Hymenoscyphus fraxineus TaxID=746836 RepID=A0A9N9KZX2_9HELO|nr:hypothetical protein HYFRA_00011657 [Hymenoscyphus fraxineus]
MPFDYVQYQQKVNTLSTEQLQKEWENYTRQIAGGATSTATSVLFSPVTGGVSLIGLGLSAPRIHNARKKREIIEAGLQARGATHNTRKRDVVAPMAVAGAISGLTLGLAGPGAEMIGGEVGAKGVEYVVAHAALDGTGAILEQKHDDHTKKKAEEKLHLQHQNFQKQNASMIGQQQAMPVPQGMYQLPGVSAPPGMVAMALQPGYQLVQDPKLGYVAAPMSISTSPTPVPQYNAISYQPVSNSQSFGQQTGPSINPGTPAPQYQQVQQTFQQPFHYSQQPLPQSQNAGYSSGKQGEIYPVQTESQQGFPPSFSEPLPVYSPTSSTPTSGPCQNEKPQPQAMKTPQITVNELPTITQPVHVAPTPESAMEQEIALLKARLLQMELEKRDIAVEPTPFSQQATVSLQSQHTSEITSPSLGGGLGCSDHQAYMPSPSPTPQPTQAKQDSSPPLATTTVSPPMRTPPPQYDITLQNQQSIAPALQQQIPSNQQEQQQQYLQQQTSLPPPPPSQNVPQPQYKQLHAHPPNITVSQLQPQIQQPYQVQQTSIQSMAQKPTPAPPDLGRQDSGYYSQPPSRTQSVSSVPLYNPHQNQNQNQNQNLSPQPTSLYSPSQHRQSISPNQSIYTPSPSTPTASNLYFPPPPGTTNIPPISPVGKTDYFATQHQQLSRMNTPQPQPQPQPQIQMQASAYKPDVYPSQYGSQQMVRAAGVPVSQHMGQMNGNGGIGGSMQPQYTGQGQMQTNGNGQTQQVHIQGTQGWQWGGQQAQFNQPASMQVQEQPQPQPQPTLQQQQQATIYSGYPVR